MQTDDQILLDQIEQVFQPRDRAIKELQDRTKALMERTSRAPGAEHASFRPSRSHAC
jgi:hypothetical protein